MTTLEEVFLQLEDTSEETSESTDEIEPTSNQVGCPSKMNSFLSSSKGPLIVEFWNVLCYTPPMESFCLSPHPTPLEIQSNLHVGPPLVSGHISYTTTFPKYQYIFFFTVKSL